MEHSPESAPVLTVMLKFTALKAAGRSIRDKTAGLPEPGLLHIVLSPSAVFSQKVPQQTNENDCGVFVLEVRHSVLS